MKLYNGNYTLGILDFDGNILNTDTPIYFKNKNTGKMEKFSAHEVDQSAQKFYGKQAIYEIVDETFSETCDFFMNNYHRGFDGLTEDVLKAIEENNFASSFESFKEIYLKEAKVFCVLTARGNSPDNFQKVFTLINDKVLTKQEKEEQRKNIILNFSLDKDTSYKQAVYHYFGNVVNYIPCNNPQIEKILFFGDKKGSYRKAKAMDFLIPHHIKFLEQTFDASIYDIIEGDKALSIGFSDDSVKNIVAVYHKLVYIIENDIYVPGIQKKFSLYFTGPKENYPSLIDQLGDTIKYELATRNIGLKIRIVAKKKQFMIIKKI